MSEAIIQCPICRRELGKKNTSKHHLIPKSTGGKHGDTVWVHNICHQKIHSVFSEKELRDRYHTISALAGHPEIQKFIKWVARKDIGFYQRNQRTKGRKLESNDKDRRKD